MRIVAEPPFSEPLGALPTETRNVDSSHLDELSTLDMLQVMSAEDAKVALAVRAELPRIAEVIDAVAQRFTGGGRL